MRMNIAAILLIILLHVCCNQHSDNTPGCMENPDAEGKLLVIIGEKIEIKEVEPWIDTVMLMSDSRFIAHYRILQKVCGEYDKDTISFTVYDHYGFPEFGNYQYALLYLIVTKKEIYHEKYLYSPLYKTKDDRWASSYSPLDYGFDEKKNTTVKPEKIDFAPEVSYSIEGFTRNRAQKWFPEPYYKIDKENKKAIAVWGNYVSELFQLKKDGVLRARGFYGKPDSIIPMPLELEALEWLKLSRKDSLQLLKVWQSLVKAIKEKDKAIIKDISLDSIVCSACEGMPREYYENDLESVEMFIDSASINFQKSGLWLLIEKNKYKFHVIKYPDRKPQNFSLKENESLIIFSISFLKNYKTDYTIYRQHHSFSFVKIGDRFRFYAMESD